MNRVNEGLQQAMDECKRELRAFRRDLTKLEERCRNGGESIRTLFKAQRELEARLGPLEWHLANIQSQLDGQDRTASVFRSHVNNQLADIYGRLYLLMDITGI